MDDKGLGQSEVLCSSSEVELLMVNYHAGFPALPALEKQISGYPPASGSSRITLTRTPPCRLTLARLLARLSALFSAFCWLPSFLLERLGGFNYWPSHRWCGVNCRRSRRWLVGVIFVERADELSKVLDR